MILKKEYVDELLSPTVLPVVRDLGRRLMKDGVKLPDVRSVYYVGGSSLDIELRKLIGGIFRAAEDAELSSNVRKNAVVDGAICTDIPLFSVPSLKLAVRVRGKSYPVFPTPEQERLFPLDQTEPLTIKSHIDVAPGHELVVDLIVNDKTVSDAVTVSGRYHNQTDKSRTVHLEMTVSSDRGCMGRLQFEGAPERKDLFHFNMGGN